MLLGPDRDGIVNHETPSNCVANISWISDPPSNKVKLAQRQFTETEHKEEQKAQTSIPCHPSQYANTSLSVLTDGHMGSPVRGAEERRKKLKPGL